MQSIHNISIPRIQMVKLLLCDLKSNINRKILLVYNFLQDANKSKIELKNSIINIITKYANPVIAK